MAFGCLDISLLGRTLIYVCVVIPERCDSAHAVHQWCLQAHQLLYVCGVGILCSLCRGSPLAALQVPEYGATYKGKNMLREELHSPLTNLSGSITEAWWSELELEWSNCREHKPNTEHLTHTILSLRITAIFCLQSPMDTGSVKCYTDLCTLVAHFKIK